MSSHHPHSSNANPDVHLYSRTDQIRAGFDLTLVAPAGSYISRSDRSRSHSGNYMSTRPGNALPGNYTSTDAASYEVGSYIDVELNR